MDTNELELKPTEMAEEQNPERKGLWLSLYLFTAAAVLTLNILMLNVVIDGFGQMFKIATDFLDSMLPWFNVLCFGAFEWLGKKLKLNLFIPFITTAVICAISVVTSYLIVVN